MKIFEVRREVLNLNIDQWIKFGKQEKFIGTIEDFLDTYGLPSGLTAKYNEDEQVFFDEIYALHRGRL